MKTDDLYTVSDLLEADWGDLLTLKKEDLKKVVDHYAFIANERRKDALKKLRASDLPTPPVYKSTKSQTKELSWYRYGFYPRSGSGVDELRKKLRMIKQFLSDKTTTFEGWEESINKFRRTVEGYINKVISKRKYKQLWKVYQKALEHEEIRARLQSEEGASDEILREITDIVELQKISIFNEDKIIKIMTDRLDEMNEDLIDAANQAIEDDDDEDADDTSISFIPNR